MVASALFVASMAHAREIGVCVDSRTAVELGHVDGDADQSPDEGGKTHPHHHSSCHGHQVAPETETATTFVRRSANLRLTPANAYLLPASTADPALRPPQA
jgi:hypothetical protein